MGGHYASFEPTEILKRTPGLDSVVRFDGEMTLVKLLHCLATGSDWRSLRGIAFRTTNREVSVAPLAQVVEDLDTLPCPDRSSIDYEGHPMPTASILGSRGCPWDCSFCSIRPFYEEQGGALRRLRSPKAIVDETERGLLWLALSAGAIVLEHLTAATGSKDTDQQRPATFVEDTEE